MIATMTETEIDALLDRVLYAHLGCHSAGRTYVVPISFARSGSDIVGCTTEGMKIQLMRENPEVCFQIDEVQDLTNWKSAIILGRFEELHRSEEIEAMSLMIDRYGPIFQENPSGSRRGREVTPDRLDGKPSRRVLYRIRISKKTGRAEIPETSNHSS
jgi:nitroimidazol reductase NimA-like FMN-containing flavoprotein (pyridoxamine 5'-phosphate oxidase superfamily)